MAQANRWETFLGTEDFSGPVREPIRPQEDRAAMPVAREGRAHSAAKATWRSKVISRRLGRAAGGFRHRRQKRTW